MAGLVAGPESDMTNGRCGDKTMTPGATTPRKGGVKQGKDVV